MIEKKLSYWDRKARLPQTVPANPSPPQVTFQSVKVFCKGLGDILSCGNSWAPWAILAIVGYSQSLCSWSFSRFMNNIPTWSFSVSAEKNSLWNIFLVSVQVRPTHGCGLILLLILSYLFGSSVHCFLYDLKSRKTIKILNVGQLSTLKQLPLTCLVRSSRTEVLYAATPLCGKGHFQQRTWARNPPLWFRLINMQLAFIKFATSKKFFFND